MKLISKNCPNCGANLAFDENDKKVTCSYCKQTSIIQKDVPTKPSDKYYENYEQNGDYSVYTLYIEKNYELEDKEDIHKLSEIKPDIYDSMYNTLKPSPPISLNRKTIVIIILVFLVTLIYGVVTDDEFKKIYHKEENETENSIKSISQIDGKSLYTIKYNATQSLDTRKDRLPPPSRSGGWEYLGMYLLVSKEQFKENNSMLYIICKKETEYNSKHLNYYGVAAYDNLYLLDSKIVLPTNLDPLIILPEIYLSDDHYRYVMGYANLQVLYNAVIKPKLDIYDVFITSGMYVE